MVVIVQEKNAVPDSSTDIKKQAILKFVLLHRRQVVFLRNAVRDYRDPAAGPLCILVEDFEGECVLYIAYYAKHALGGIDATEILRAGME